MTDTETLIARLKVRAGDQTPASAEEVQAAEERLKIPLPLLLRQLYLSVGVSGGPGDAGLLPLPVKLLPGRLYPLCDWGSGISSALDCMHPEAPVIRIDPNMAKADVPARVPPALHFDRAAEVKAACWVEAPSLAQWLTDWLDGVPLFYAAYRGADDEEDEDDLDEDDADEV